MKAVEARFAETKRLAELKASEERLAEAKPRRRSAGGGSEACRSEACRGSQGAEEKLAESQRTFETKAAEARLAETKRAVENTLAEAKVAQARLAETKRAVEMTLAQAKPAVETRPQPARPASQRGEWCETCGTVSSVALRSRNYGARDWEIRVNFPDGTDQLFVFATDPGFSRGDRVRFESGRLTPQYPRRTAT
jgi:hypothetical protein